MTITPASVDGFPKTGRPWNNITPFTYRDGLTYLEVLEALRAYVRDYLVQHINDELNGLVDDWQEQVSIIENAVSDALAQHSQEMHELADRWMQEQIENNDEITANILALSSSLTKTALEPVLVEYVAQAGSVQDAVDNRAVTSVEQAVVANTTLREAVDNRARTSVEQAVLENTTLRDAVDSRARASIEQAVISETGELSDTMKQATLNTATEGATNVTAFRDAIDQRVTVGTADAISTALADSQTLKDAAVAAMSDAALQEQLAWHKPQKTSGSLDELLGASAVGLHPISPSVASNPRSANGWVEVTYHAGSARTRQRYAEATPSRIEVQVRTHSAGEWSEWRPDEWLAAPVSTGSADTIRMPAAYPIMTSNVTEMPFTGIGLLEVLPIGQGSSTLMQRASSWGPSSTSWTRTLVSGAWRPWVQSSSNSVATPVSVDVDTLLQDASFNVTSGNTPGLPVANPGWLTVKPASGYVLQMFVSATSEPAVFYRRWDGDEWGAWSSGQDDSGDPILPGRVAELESRLTSLESGRAYAGPVAPVSMSLEGKPASDIAAIMSGDRSTLYSNYGTAVKASIDGGHTWATVETFAGQQVESVDALGNGELLITTTRSGSLRRVYVSDGLPSGSASWDIVLDSLDPYVKFAPAWSIQHVDNIVLLAEYGPKSGYAWGSSEIIEAGKNARRIRLSTDYGRTWDVVFDLNEYLVVEHGHSSVDGQHLHGVAWDSHWDRIWATFGDNLGGNGSNGIAYSDDFGATWRSAHYYSGPSGGDVWQVVTVIPMRDAVLFAGDMTPSGLMRIPRSAGKHNGTYTVETAYVFDGPGKHLCQAWNYQVRPDGREHLLVGFGAEGAVSPSFIVGTRDGISFSEVWRDTETQRGGFGIRSICGPTLQGEIIVASNDQRDSSAWSEWRGAFPY